MNGQELNGKEIKFMQTILIKVNVFVFAVIYL